MQNFKWSELIFVKYNKIKKLGGNYEK